MLCGGVLMLWRSAKLKCERSSAVPKCERSPAVPKCERSPAVPKFERSSAAYIFIKFERSSAAYIEFERSPAGREALKLHMSLSLSIYL